MQQEAYKNNINKKIQKRAEISRLFIPARIKKYFAFTMAEILVVLLIIGVSASLTIPAVINDIQNAEYKTAYKKAYSTASQALLRARTENLLFNVNDWDDVNNDNNFNAFKNQLKVAKDCNNNNNASCWTYSSTQLYYGGCPTSDAPAFIDSAGMSWSRSGLGGYSGNEIIVDTNGLKGPNVYGKDRFLFFIYPKKYPGIPSFINVIDDIPEINATYCPSGGCYYTSWLK